MNFHANLKKKLIELYVLNEQITNLTNRNSNKIDRFKHSQFIQI